jgi:hypothetical protein
VAELVVSAEVDAPADVVWAKLIDWPTHGAWMLFTEVDRTTDEADGDGVGTGIVGITKLGPLAVRDTMTITTWQPSPADPARCVVAHTGTIVRGAGAFEVESIDGERSRVVWSEWVRLPLGLVGELGWLGVRPVVAVFLKLSLRRLARYVESGQA